MYLLSLKLKESSNNMFDVIEALDVLVVISAMIA